MRKQIPNYEGLYDVDELGNVYSVKRNKILKPSLSRSGYLQINLSKNNKNKCYFIHQLVILSFIDKDYLIKKLVCDHIDNNKLNNSLSNLQILTHRLNKSKDRNENKYSNLTGVSFNKSVNKFVSQIRIDGKLKYLGSFDTDVEANNKYKEELNKVLHLKQ